MKKVVKYIFSLVVLCLAILVDVGSDSNEEMAVVTPHAKVVLAEEIQLDVPLLNQMDDTPIIQWLRSNEFGNVTSILGY